MQCLVLGSLYLKSLAGNTFNWEWKYGLSGNLWKMMRAKDCSGLSHMKKKTTFQHSRTNLKVTAVSESSMASLLFSACDACTCCCATCQFNLQCIAFKSKLLCLWCLSAVSVQTFNKTHNCEPLVMSFIAFHLQPVPSIARYLKYDNKQYMQLRLTVKAMNVMETLTFPLLILF